MKKLICMVCAVALMLTLTGCGKIEPSAYDQGLETVALMAEAMGSEAYLNIMSTANVFREHIAKAAEGDYHTPKAAFAISFPNEVMGMFAGIMEPAEIPDALTELRKSGHRTPQPVELI